MAPENPDKNLLSNCVKGCRSGCRDCSAPVFIQSLQETALRLATMRLIVVTYGMRASHTVSPLTSFAKFVGGDAEIKIELFDDYSL